MYSINSATGMLVSNTLRKIDPYLLALGIMCAIYAGFFTYYTIMKHLTFHTMMYDLGIYDHMFWKLVKYGETLPTISGLIHDSFTLYLIAPIYAFFPSPTTLLVIQAIVVPLSAIPLYLLAANMLSRKTALAVAMLFLLYPPLHGLSQFDFHVEALLLPLLTTDLYLLYQKRWKAFTISTVLTLLTMEVTIFIVAAMLVFAAIKNRTETAKIKLNIKWKEKSKEVEIKAPLIFTHKRTAVALTAILGISAILIASPTFHRILEALSRRGLGKLENIQVMRDQKISYLIKLFGPLSFLPLLSPTPLIMALPWLGYISVTTEPEYLKIYNQYSAFTTPFIFTSLVETLGKINHKKRLTAICLLITVASTAYFILTTDPVTKQPWPTITERDQILHKLISLIPDEAPILTQNNIAPHLTRRKHIYISTPKDGVEVEYILIDTKVYHYWYSPAWPSTKQVAEKLLKTNNYCPVHQHDGIKLYKKCRS